MGAETQSETKTITNVPFKVFILMAQLRGIISSDGEEVQGIRSLDGSFGLPEDQAHRYRVPRE